MKLRLLAKCSSAQVDQDEFVQRMLDLLGGIEDEDIFDDSLFLMMRATPLSTPRLVEGIFQTKLKQLVSSMPTHLEAAQLDCADLMRQIAEDPDMLILIDVRSQEERVRELKHTVLALFSNHMHKNK